MRLRKSQNLIFHRKQNLYFTVILFLFVFIGVGYAILTSNLNIKGNAKIAKATWDVHFENVQSPSSNTGKRLYSEYVDPFMKKVDVADITYELDNVRPTKPVAPADKKVFANKKVVVIGNSNKNYLFSSTILSQIVNLLGGEVVYASDYNYNATAAGCMDLDTQKKIKNFADQYGSENLALLISSEDGESAASAAETVISGDPTYAGPLTGVSLNLSVYHVCEDVITSSLQTLSSNDVTLNSTTEVSFSSVLANPNDVFSFTVDVVNKGSIDAMISQIVKKGLSSEQSKYLNFVILYSNGLIVQEKDRLPAGEKKTLLVKVVYKDVGFSFVDDQKMKLTLNLEYVQADNTAIDRTLIKGQQIIIIGDRDGAPASIIRDCVEAAGGTVIASYDRVGSNSIGYAIEFEIQKGIKDAVDKYGAANITVISGTPDVDDADMLAETFANGDPTFSGPLTGLALELPIYHICELVIKSEIPSDLYDEQIGLVEMVIDVNAIVEALSSYRNN